MRINSNNIFNTVDVLVVKQFSSYDRLLPLEALNLKPIPIHSMKAITQVPNIVSWRKWVGSKKEWFLYGIVVPSFAT